MGQAALLRVEAGDAARAIGGFEDFLKSYPNSARRPNAEFALALAYGASGQKAKSQAPLAGFIHDYPSHPLVGDARRMSEAMKKPQFGKPLRAGE